MKSIFVVIILITHAMYVTGEQCNTISDCVQTLCLTNSSHIACHWNLCVCDAVVTGCSDAASCRTIGRCHKHDEAYHCLDGHCMCLKEDKLPGHGHHH